jgi:hypothetical protein
MWRDELRQSMRSVQDLMIEKKLIAKGEPERAAPQIPEAEEFTS